MRNKRFVVGRVPFRSTAAAIVALGAASLFLGLAQAPVGASVPTLIATPAVANFGGVTLGTFAGDNSTQFWLQNQGGSTDTIDLADPNDLAFSGPGADDYVVTQVGGCAGNGSNIITMTPGYQCLMQAWFFPGALGNRDATAMIKGSADSQGTPLTFTGQGTIGYYQVDEFGDVANYGDAAWYGDTGNDNLNSPIVGMATTGDDGGYWLVAADGGIFNYGQSAGFYGSAGAIPLNKPIVGMAATPDAAGYWLVATDGGIFSYGDAPFYGSTGSLTLNKPIVGMAADPATGGYWLVASDGGIFAYNAPFYGSTGSIHLNKPIVGMVAAPSGNGYWLVASDGGIFAYGPGAPFYGSTGSLPLVQPITSMAAVPDGSGYWFSAADGGLFSYKAPFYGSGTNDPNLDIVVDMATDGSAPLQSLVGLPALRTAAERAHAPAALRAGLAAGNR